MTDPLRHEDVTSGPSQGIALLPIASPSSRTRLLSPRGLARARRAGARALTFAPALLVLAADLTLRGPRIATLDPFSKVTYAGTAMLGGSLWGGLLLAASRRRGGLRWVASGLLCAAALLAVGGQVYAYRRYMAFLDDNSVLVGTSLMPSVRQELWFDRASLVRALAPPLLAAVLLIWASRRLAPTRKTHAAASFDVALVVLCVVGFELPAHGDHRVGFDVLYVSGMGRLGRALWDHNEFVERLHPGPRTPAPLPPLTSRPKVPRNVLLIVTESVCSSSTCVAYDDNCTFTPFSNAAAPDRIGLRQMRAVDSTTAISLSVMWSGLAPTEPRANLHSAPLVWEYAHAAGYATAYWTSQNLLFGNSGTWLDGIPLDLHISATELQDDPTLELGADDGKVVDHAIGQMRDLKEPFFAVVHLSNTHFPYWIDEDDAPFQPQSEAGGPGHEVEIKNRYQDAIYRQDRAVGRLIGAARRGTTALPTVLLFVSDHGEQMREKGSLGHTGTLFDPEIHIPTWFQAPAGALTPGEESSLRSLTETPLTTMDVMPTLLDLLGLWDAPEIAELVGRIPGTSLLRGGSPLDNPVLLTNCTELWACAFKNWGVIRGSNKLVATQADRAWNCFDLAADPDEVHDLGPSGCGDLAAIAESGLHGRPF
jgi:glucan phosphoethanolaminetransferase (alkaline phosphatase superfamily)